MNTDLIDRFVEFLTGNGIPVAFKTIDNPTSLPGLTLQQGTLVIDREKLLYPGDVLHEGGHLAVMTPAIRVAMTGDLPKTDLHMGGEIMTLAWCYAACLHLDIDPHVVFHADGYKGDGESIIQRFASGDYFGLPLLQWAGLTYDSANAARFNVAPFPKMIRWVREA